MRFLLEEGLTPKGLRDIFVLVFLHVHNWRAFATPADLDREATVGRRLLVFVAELLRQPLGVTAAGSQWSPCEWVISRWSITAGAIPAHSRPFRPVTE